MNCVTCGASLAASDATCPTCGELAGGDRPTGGPAIGTAAAGTAGRAPADGPPPAPASREDRADDVAAGAAAAGAASGPPPHGGGPAGSPPPHGPGAGGAAGGYGPPPAPHPSGLSSEVRGWAIGAHLGGLVLGVLTAAFLGFLAPMLVWLLKRDEHAYLDHHGKEALNFQLTVIVAVVVAALLTVPAILFGVLTLGIGFVVVGALLLAAVIVWFVFPIMGAVKAANGEGFRYPLSIRFIA